MIELHFLPYGRVDAILIGVGAAPESSIQPSAVFPEGKLGRPEGSANLDWHWAFVDGGYRSDGKQAVKYIRGLGIERLEAYIASHRHRNHVGAGPVVIRSMLPKAIYTCHPDMGERLSQLSQPAEQYMVEHIEKVMLGMGDSFRVGEAVFTCIGPEKVKKCTSGAYAENQNSLILRVEYKGRSVLLTGDTTASILGDCPDDLLRCEVLKNPHHNGALGEKLLRRIRPNITVVCNGKPPAKYYRKRLEGIGCKLYTAGKKGDGLVVLEGDESGWRIRQTKGA